MVGVLCNVGDVFGGGDDVGKYCWCFVVEIVVCGFVVFEIDV